MKLKLISFTPALAVAGAYSSGDQVGAINTASEAIDWNGGVAVLKSVTLLDGAKQDKALDLLFFSSSPTVTSIDNGAFALLDSEMLGKCLGKVSIAATDYSDAAASSVASKTDLSQVLKAAAGSRDLFCILVARDAPTYTNGDLKVLLGLETS